MMNLLTLIYPDRCPICDKARPLKETGVCPECTKKIIAIKGPVCPVCGRMMGRNASYINQTVCEECLINDIYYDGGRSALAYSCLNDSIYKFKYMNRAPYAKEYARLMLEECGDWIDEINPDAIIPVPLHKNRLIKRGYNQATELALEISLITKIPVNDTCIRRFRNTIPQKLMGKRDRKRNMKKAFIVIENVVNLRRVLIIDDIFTTGSTINSMAMELKKAGVSKVYFLTLARAGV